MENDIPGWVGWVLTGVIIPAGAYMGQKFIAYLERAQKHLERAQELADERSRAFIDYLKEGDARHAVEREAWRATVDNQAAAGHRQADALGAIVEREVQEMEVLQGIATALRTIASRPPE